MHTWINDSLISENIPGYPNTCIHYAIYFYGINVYSNQKGVPLSHPFFF